MNVLLRFLYISANIPCVTLDSRCILTLSVFKLKSNVFIIEFLHVTNGPSYPTQETHSSREKYK